MNVVINPADKKLLIPLLEEKLQRMKAIKPHEDNRLATDMYKKELVRVLKRLNPKSWYYV